VITAFVVGCICFLPFPSWQSLVGLITSASVLMYAGAPLALGVFRGGCPTPSGRTGCPPPGSSRRWPSSSPGLIILWSGWDTDWKLGRRDPARLRDPRADRGSSGSTPTTRSCSGGPPVAAGLPDRLGVIVYLSPYGPLKNPVIPLWWDIAAVAVFSLIIYYWALAVALPTAEIERMVDEVVPPRRRVFPGY
jgi:amino acid transporter